MTETREAASDFLARLGQFGKTGETGVTRPVYTDAWIAAVSWLQKEAQGKHMDVSVDANGTTFMSYPGSESTEIVAAGSHIDSVVNGGRYDGAYGVAAAYLAITDLYAEYGQPKKTMTAVAISEEDAARFPTTFSGSKHYAQVAETDPDIKDADGITFGQARAHAIAALPAFVTRQDQPLPSEWFELHIEQGPVLATTGIQLGVVSSICELKRFNVTLTGQANHAGTTPQHLRKDPMKAAARMITALDDYAKAVGEPLVFTVGSLTVEPGASNAIPSQVVFSIDVRHPKKAVVDDFEAKLNEQIAALTTVSGYVDSLMEPYPEVVMDERLQHQFAEICEAKGYRYQVMPSGAGHDTQIMNRKTKTAMLFVPSRDGISHSPAEYTAPEDLERGIAVLKAQLYRECY
ncbi:Zn-dependent hydrolase [Lacticaseibacillus baoqingensis]|uniref:Zn-dependent hydrolase n=1 Tax=Lacticaseibacillus baoqingensis TaxID=2486013 RepID=A0ABW4EAG2_9LACO|nr:Zn-dependent hydrolase [Lacticaseibacillus baoqingensis]